MLKFSTASVDSFKTFQPIFESTKWVAQEFDETFNGNFKKMTDQELDGLRGSSPERENGKEAQSSSKSQSKRSEQNQKSSEKMNNTLTIFKNKMKDGKRAIVRLKRQQEDAQLDVIISDLMLLESRLRKEQCQILSQLESRDATICVQRQEIDRLRRDNRRLISRLKKITEGRDSSKEDSSNGKQTSTEPSDKDEHKSPGKKSSKVFSKRSPQSHHQIFMNRPFIKQSVMTSLTSQFYEKSALQFTDENGKIVDRVLHKPPIAEKPKLSALRASHRPITTIVRTSNGQCNIVSTISRLLDEESDHGINGSSGSSEPSSPEATLKPSTPRVIKLARQYEKGLVVVGSSSSESGRSGDEQSVKAMIMDEHEVTSGYNSDAVSDQDHDYENIVLYKGKSEPEGDSNRSRECHKNSENEDNYVILRAVRDEFDNTVLIEDIEEDQHIYSNIEYGVKEEPKKGDLELYSEEAKEAMLRQLLETNVDSSNEGLSSESSSEVSESPKRVQNVPRSRHNINLVIGSSSSSSTSEESHLMDNFEEFTLDSLDLEDLNGDEVKGKENLPLLTLRHSGDGAEAKNPTSKEQRDLKNLLPGQGGYEKFLEVTGLSQKSILTPSRMFSNHRSVLKPRDIKHRDKLRAAFTSLSTLEEVTIPSGTTSPNTSPDASTSYSPNSSQRYWREPYL